MLKLLTDISCAKGLLLAATALTMPTHLFAQGADVASSPADNADDIVVTALRRDQRVQDVPASITAISGATLSKLGAKDFLDFYRAVPSLQITANPVTPGASRISIRGVFAAGESTVGLYYGDTPVTGPSGNLADPGGQVPNLNLFDVARVEVLRGPQGTLYGAGSVGGTIRVIFEQPKVNVTEGHVEAQGSTTQHGGLGGSLRGALNIPVIADILALRVVGFAERTAGYVDNVRFNQKNINTGTASGGRAILAFTPTDNFDLTGTAIYQESHQNDNATWFQLYGKQSYKTDSPIKVPYDDKMRVYTVTSNWILPFVKITGTASHYKWNIVREGDGTVALYPSIIGTAASSPLCKIYNGISENCTTAQLTSYKNYALSTLPASFHAPIREKVDNQELRFASVGKSWLDWTVGVFHEKRADSIDNYLAKVDAATGVLIEPLQSSSYRVIGTDFSQFSQFAELSAHPLTGITVTGGARHFKYTKTVSGQVLQTGIVLGSFAGPQTSVRQSESGWVGKAGISYNLEKDILLYAQWAQGFRPGGANNVPNLAQTLVPYASDSLESYEAGVKTTLLGGMATFNLAAFQIDWSNIQSAAIVLPAFRIITNAGDARIQGIEMEATVRPIIGLQLNTGMSYIPSAKLTSAQTGSGIVTTGQSGLVGDRLPYTAKFTGNFSADYSWEVNSSIMAFVRGDLNYHGKSANEFRPTYVNYETLAGFAELNAKIGMNKGKWGAYLFVNNVTNEIGAVGVQSIVTAAPYQAERIIGTIRPRTFGINLSAGF
ncbi:outer membrane receptor protein involved in Fe transport [Sphingobium boeckii]|uniref:Outer membrane receptor protein involved in Fe transport n=2 Tax=Sphingobium boeckii TaxID=1082345 RepID=A0A7W9AFQ4_9SPHN|nr:outer membrane receptor protein involved in Fe transport [Sphingobium boeckii]